jgi:hypothetical protein
MPFIMASQSGRRDLKTRGVAVTLLAGLAGLCFIAESRANTVMSWVPAYEVENSVDALHAPLDDGRTVGQALSRLALQFWVPDGENLILDKRVSEADVRRLVTAAKQNNLQVLLVSITPTPMSEDQDFRGTVRERRSPEENAPLSSRSLPRWKNSSSTASKSTLNRNVTD